MAFLEVPAFKARLERWASRSVSNAVPVSWGKGGGCVKAKGILDNEDDEAEAASFPLCVFCFARWTRTTAGKDNSSSSDGSKS